MSVIHKPLLGVLLVLFAAAGLTGSSAHGSLPAEGDIGPPPTPVVPPSPQEVAYNSYIESLYAYYSCEDAASGWYDALDAYWYLLHDMYDAGYPMGDPTATMNGLYATYDGWWNGVVATGVNVYNPAVAYQNGNYAGAIAGFFNAETAWEASDTTATSMTNSIWNAYYEQEANFWDWMEQQEEEEEE